MGFVSLSFPYGMFVSQGLCLELISLHTTLDFNEMVSLCTLFLLSSMFCVLSPYEKAAVQMWFKTNSKFQNFTTLSLLHSYFLESGKFKIKVTLPRKKKKKATLAWSVGSPPVFSEGPLLSLRGSHAGWTKNTIAFLHEEIWPPSLTWDNS